MCILPIDNPKTLWYNRPARERTWRAEFLSIGGLHKFLGQIFVHNVNRQNPELVLYYKYNKGKGNANMMNFEVYSLLRKCLDNGTFTGMDALQAKRACQKFEEAREEQKKAEEKRKLQDPA